MTTAPTGFPLPLRNALAALAIEALDDPAARAALGWLAATPAESAPPTVRADLAAHHLVEADGTLVDIHRPHEARMRAHAERALRAADAYRVAHDDVAVFEVMTGDLDRAWWDTYRRELERRFRQDKIVVRAVAHEVL